MLYNSRVPHQLWVEAFFTAAFLINLLPSSVLTDKKSPYELLHKTRSLYTALRVFGCKCYPSLRPYMSNKLDPKSLACVFLGYNEKYKRYRCYYPPTGKFFISRHVLFDESSFPYMDLYSRLHQDSTSSLLNAWRAAYLQPVSEPAVSSEAAPEELPPQHVSQVTEPMPVQAASPVPPPTPPDVSDAESDLDDHEVQQNQQVAVEAMVHAVHPMTTRARVGIVKPNPKYALLTIKDEFAEPKFVKAALKHKGWTKSMGVEIDNMKESETFELVPPADDQNPLGSRWVYKTKRNADGTVLCLRSRLVAKGNEQEEGVDFIKTFSPVVRTATIRAVLHVAVTKKWALKQLDVQNAFLHGDLKETLYLSQPPGFVDSEKPDYVWKLKKAIYGLKQAPRAWFDKFSSFLLEFGFTCTFPDPSLFIYHRGSDVIYLLLYVDDMILTGNNNQLLDKLLV